MDEPKYDTIFGFHRNTKLFSFFCVCVFVFLFKYNKIVIALREFYEY